MSTVILLFFGALVIAIAVTPVSKWLAPHVGMIAVPRTRDIHTRPVPRMGGIAIFIGVMAVTVLFSNQAFIREAAAILFGAALMSFLGLIDDRFSLSAYVRLLAQLGTAFLMWYVGVRVQVFATPALDAALTMIWIVGITNAMNFLDNMDGLLAGISAVISAFFLLLAVINGQYLISLLSAAVLGACIGFLIWNLNPASVFMGDSGSMFLGFLLAVIAIKLRFMGQSLSVSWMIPVIIMGLPIFDMSLVSISRLRRGKNPLTTPGKDHSSHRIADHGFTRREAVMILYLVCGALGVTAVLSSFADIFANYLIAAALLALGLFMLWFMEFGPWKLSQTQTSPPPNPLPQHTPTQD
jgi:UDP-GlcNAc:undecaprenyl-phosphate GlcNAc-1-phosphate transferase